MEIIDTPEKMRARARQIRASLWAGANQETSPGAPGDSPNHGDSEPLGNSPSPASAGSPSSSDGEPGPSPRYKIGFVPTMGFLHEGHLSLVQAARKECEVVIVSIFVNPIQFNNKEDLAKYPSNIEGDKKLLEEAGVDILFMPTKEDVYPGGEPDLFIDYPEITSRLCGADRPGHFSGVLTIVHNLFMWTMPEVAWFGLKDYQQYLLIKKMAHDLSLDIEIRPGELVRDKNGLALSSRNSRLSQDGLQEALKISRALFAVESAWRANPNEPAGRLQEFLTEGLSGLEVQYAGVYDPETLVELSLEESVPAALVAVAAVVEGVRLIDNVVLG